MSESSVAIRIGAHAKVEDATGGIGGNLSIQGLLGHIWKPVMLIIITT